MELKDKYTKAEAEEITNGFLFKAQDKYRGKANISLKDRAVVLWDATTIYKVFSLDGSRNINRSLKEIETFSL